MNYVLTVDGYVITEPMSLEDIQNAFGDLEDLKKAGILVKRLEN